VFTPIRSASDSVFAGNRPAELSPMHQIFFSDDLEFDPLGGARANETFAPIPRDLFLI
jgi:hypothetical protein